MRVVDRPKVLFLPLQTTQFPAERSCLLSSAPLLELVISSNVAFPSPGSRRKDTNRMLTRVRSTSLGKRYQEHAWSRLVWMSRGQGLDVLPSSMLTWCLGSPSAVRVDTVDYLLPAGCE
eukprot:2413377-Amphidinium_carterae.1